MTSAVTGRQPPQFDHETEMRLVEMLRPRRGRRARRRRRGLISTSCFGGNRDLDRCPARHCASRLRPRSGSGSSLAEARSSHCWRRTRPQASEVRARQAEEYVQSVRRPWHQASAHTAGSRASAKECGGGSICVHGGRYQSQLEPLDRQFSWSAINPTDMTKGRIGADSVCILKWSLGGRF